MVRGSLTNRVNYLRGVLLADGGMVLADQGCKSGSPKKGLSWRGRRREKGHECLTLLQKLRTGTHSVGQPRRLRTAS